MLGRSSTFLVGAFAGGALIIATSTPAPELGPINAANLPANSPIVRNAYELPWANSISLPPEDMRGDARALIEFIDPEMIESACDEWSTACTLPASKTIRMPNPCAFTWDTYAKLLCHELGHIHGFDHPDEDAETAREIERYKRRCRVPQVCGDRL